MPEGSRQKKKKTTTTPATTPTTTPTTTFNAVGGNTLSDAEVQKITGWSDAEMKNFLSQPDSIPKRYYTRYLLESADAGRKPIKQSQFNTKVGESQGGFEHSYGALMKSEEDKQTGVNEGIKNQLKQFNTYMAAGDTESAQAILENIKTDDPNYDISQYQTKIDTKKTVTPPTTPTTTPAGGVTLPGGTTSPTGNISVTPNEPDKYANLTDEQRKTIDLIESKRGMLGDKRADELINQKIGEFGTTATAPDNSGTTTKIDGVVIPTYDYKTDPGYETIQGVKKSYLDTLEKEVKDDPSTPDVDESAFKEPELTAKYVAPELTAEMVQNWDKTLQEWDSVSDTKDDERLIRSLDAQDPYGAGSGDRATKLSALIAERGEARKTRATTYAQEQLSAQTDTAQTQYKQELAEWEKKYGTAWSQYEMKQQEIENSKLKLAEIAEFESNASKYQNSQERENAWTAIQRQWTERDNALAKAQELEVQGRSIAANRTSQLTSGLQSSGLSSQNYTQTQQLQNDQNTQDLATAKLYENANKKTDWDYIAPVLSGVASGLTGGLSSTLGAGLANKYLSGKYSSKATSTGETNYTA